MFTGYAIIPPVSPWDEKHKDAIQLDNARRTIGATEAKPVYYPRWWMFAAAVLLWLLLTLAIVVVL